LRVAEHNVYQRKKFIAMLIFRLRHRRLERERARLAGALRNLADTVEQASVKQFGEFLLRAVDTLARVESTAERFLRSAKRP
jgi:hypothetical protein